MPNQKISLFSDFSPLCSLIPLGFAKQLECTILDSFCIALCSVILILDIHNAYDEYYSEILKVRSCSSHYWIKEIGTRPKYLVISKQIIKITKISFGLREIYNISRDLADNR